MLAYYNEMLYMQANLNLPKCHIKFKAFDILVELGQTKQLFVGSM